MGGSSGGGGSSGRVDFPGYMKNSHSWLLNADNDIDTIADLGLGGASAIVLALTAGATPYATAAAYDPDADLDDSKSFVDDHIENAEKLDETRFYPDFWALTRQVSGVDQLLDAEDIFDDVIAIVDEFLISDSDINDEVTQFTAKTLTDFNAEDARLSASICLANAGQTSSFVGARAIVSRDRTRAINEFRANLQMERARQRPQAGATLLQHFREVRVRHLDFLKQSVTDLTNMMFNRFETFRTATALLTEINRIKIVAKKEQLASDIEYNVRDVEFDFTVYQQMANILSSIQGSVSKNKTDSPSSGGLSQIGGVLSGAASGAMIGSAAGPPGAIVGGILGAAAGLASG